MARHHLGATWIDDESLAYTSYSGAPSNSRRRGLVRFPDGELRTVKLGVPDTYFTIPAIPVSGGRKGYVDVSDGEFAFHSKSWKAPAGRARRRPDFEPRSVFAAVPGTSAVRRHSKFDPTQRGVISIRYTEAGAQRLAEKLERETGASFTVVRKASGEWWISRRGQPRNKRRRRPAGSMIRRHRRAR